MSMRSILFFVICFKLLCEFATPSLALSVTSRRVAAQQQRNIAVRDAVIFRKHVTTTTPAPHVKRSWKCLIQELAQFNHIKIDFHFVKESGTVNNKTFTYQINLGNEVYKDSDISKKKAEQKVSEDAYNKTRYSRPPMTPKMCLIAQSPINVVQEWAQKRKIPVVYYVKDQVLGPDKKYVVECAVGPNITAEGQSPDKKIAKAEAAEKMLDTLRSMNMQIYSISNKMDKYNDTKAIKMNPVSRLNEIQLTLHELEPIYKTQNEVRFNENGQKVKFFVIEVIVGNLVAVGSGESVKEAKRDAAKKMLRNLNFIV